MKTFKHSGDQGDIIYSLPSIQALGGGRLYLDPTGGAKDDAVQDMLKMLKRDRLKFNADSAEFLAPLLREQSYVEEVFFLHEGIDLDRPLQFNLNEHRRIVMANPMVEVNGHHRPKNIVELHAECVGVDVDTRKSWLTIPEDLKYDGKCYKTVVGRNLRYQSSHHAWEMLAQDLDPQSTCFVGTELEHKVFTTVYGVDIPHEKVDTALDMAQIINNCETFMGNQSLPLAIAIGLGTDFIEELYPKAANCIFPHGRYV